MDLNVIKKGIIISKFYKNFVDLTAVKSNDDGLRIFVIFFVVKVKQVEKCNPCGAKYFVRKRKQFFQLSFARDASN